MLAVQKIEEPVPRPPIAYLLDEEIEEIQDGKPVYVPLAKLYELTPAPLNISRYAFNRLREERPEQYPQYRLLSNPMIRYTKSAWTTDIVTWVKLHSVEISRYFGRHR